MHRRKKLILHQCNVVRHKKVTPFIVNNSLVSSQNWIRCSNNVSTPVKACFSQFIPPKYLPVIQYSR